MIKTCVGDITKLTNIDYICNAANGIGPMGAGVAGAIKRAGGVSIEQEAYKFCSENFAMPGSIYVTNAGTLPYDKVIHLVTMKYPGSKTEYKTIKELLNNLITFCKTASINKIALPALGTGIGRLDFKKVADIYIETLESSEIEFNVVDINRGFIDYINNKLSKL